MVKLKKYNIDGKEVGEVEVQDSLLQADCSTQAVKDYIVAIRNNARQWSANTKGRSEINHSNAKPHPQKGTGRARQGTIKAPQYKGGGIVFGPKPKFDQHTRINRKERQSAIRFLLSEKVKEGQLRILQLEKMDQPKTKRVAQFLKQVGIDGKKLLVLSDEEKACEKERRDFFLSMRNVKKASFMPMRCVSGYDVMKHQEIVVVESAYNALLEKLGG